MAKLSTVVINPIHKDPVPDVEVPVFCGQYPTQETNIFCYALVQIFHIIHNFFNAPLVILPFHLMKITKEKKMSFPAFYLFCSECTIRKFGPGGQHCKNDSIETIEEA